MTNARIHAGIQRVKGDKGSGPPLKNHKNMGFLSHSGLDPLANYKATKPAFNVGPALARQGNAILMVFPWQADVGQIIVVFVCSLAPLIN